MLNKLIFFPYIYIYILYYIQFIENLILMAHWFIANLPGKLFNKFYYIENEISPIFKSEEKSSFEPTNRIYTNKINIIM